MTQAEAASMGPLPFGSGRANCARSRRERFEMLQWGRSLSEAEGSPRRSRRS